MAVKDSNLSVVFYDPVQDAMYEVSLQRYETFLSQFMDEESVAAKIQEVLTEKAKELVSVGVAPEEATTLTLSLAEADGVNIVKEGKIKTDDIKIEDVAVEVTLDEK